MPQPTPTSLLSPQERLRVRPAVFEDFSRSMVPPPAEEAPLAEPPPALSEPLPKLAEESPVHDANPDTLREQELQAAYEQGFEDGKTAAAALYEAEFRRHHQWWHQLDTLMHSLREHFEQLQQTMEHVAVRLAFVLAEHILGSHLRQDPTAVERLLRRALQNIPGGDGPLRIHLHPETLEALRRAGSTFVSGHDSGILLIGDPSVEPTGCLIESPWGIADAQLHQQLQNIREQLQW